MKILSMNFQRNGVSGQPFYTLEYQEDGKRLAATFATLGEGEYKSETEYRKEDSVIDSGSCRVIEFGVNSAWRGDVAASNIQWEFKKSHRPTFYDWMKSLNDCYNPGLLKFRKNDTINL